MSLMHLNPQWKNMFTRGIHVVFKDDTMTKIFTIKNPYILSKRDNRVEVVFPYSIYSKGKGLYKDNVSEHEIKVGITTLLLITWGYRFWESESLRGEIIKLAFPFAIEFLKEKYQDGT